MMKLLIISIFSCLIFFHLNAGAPKYSNEFLSVGVGAKALGMGSSGIAIVNDITSGYWNPAGLNEIQNKWSFGLMHAEYFAGIANYDFISSARRIDDRSVIGVSVIRMGVDGILNTTELIDKDGNFNYDNISEFSVADYAFITSFAKDISIDKLQIGGNVKVIYRNIGKFANAYGFGFDIGMQYQKNEWQFGAMIHDLTSTFNVWVFNQEELEIEVLDSVFNKVPENKTEITLPRIALGISRNFKLNDKFCISPVFDVEITTDGKRNTAISAGFLSFDPRIGFEADYKKIVFARFGINNMQIIPDFDKDIFTVQPNFGIGIHFRNFFIDYALSDIGSTSLLYSHVFSVIFSIH